MPTTPVPDSPVRPTLSRRHSVGIASARSWLLTVLGEFVLPANDPVWTSTIVTVLGGLGLEEKAARQSLARTAADELIQAERVGRRTRWRLTDSGRHLLSEGAERIYSFAGQESTWDGHWLVITTAVPEGQRDLRHRLRTRMAWAGFGSLGANTWISPNTAREAEAKQLLDDLGLSTTTLSFTGQFAGIGTEKSLVEQAWDLRGIAGRYREFLAEFAGRRPRPGEATMLAQVRLVHEWRRFPFLDPQLPAELLPPDWIGARAAAVFRRQHTAWHRPAQAHWRSLAARDDH
jgi:phenylacetic acid degradation operon negative regulatory protein